MSGNRETPKALPGPIFHEPLFAEQEFVTDPKGFIRRHPSDNKLYKFLGDRLKKNTVPFPKSRIPNDEFYTLEEAYGPRGKDIINEIAKAGRVVFHALGDSGATREGKPYKYELDLVEQMVEDCAKMPSENRPAFLFHLGDIVYDFGESAYYYDQFYDAFRNYPGPIFAIPGNHDSFVASIAPPDVAPQEQGVEDPLKIFMRNFCSDAPVITPEARSLHRTAMTQPGVYFALDAPFARIIALFSNALEDPGLISSEDGFWSNVPDHQLGFLETQLETIKNTGYQGAILLAMHHPPFTYRATAETGEIHQSSLAMLSEIDKICCKVGVYPHAILSGHAHNYQRFSRSFHFAESDIEVPFIVTGSGGHHVNPLTRAGYKADLGFDVDVSYLDPADALGKTKLVLKHYNDRDYTYLRCSADTVSLRIASYVAAGRNAVLGRFDKVTVDLKTHRILPN